MEIKSVQELKDKMPGAFKELNQHILNENLDDVDINDFDEIKELIQEAGNNKETTDSCYIYDEWIIKLELFSFSITGSSYRKDQSICDIELDEPIYVENLEELKLSKEEKRIKKQKNQREKSNSQWENVVTNKTRDEIIIELKNYKFPAKYKE
jgi:hypothetical protein